MRAISVGRAVDLFLAHLSASAKEATRLWYAQFLGEFRRAHGTRALANLTPAVLDRWIAATYGERTPATQHAAARTVIRLCNWAVNEKLLDSPPLRGFRNCPPSSRELILSGADYAALVKAADKPTRDAIKFLWHTGARPQELRAIQADWIRDGKIVFPRTASKGGKKRRVIYLDSFAAAIAARLAQKNATGPIFRNRAGGPWSTATLAQAFQATRRRAGVPGACAYAIRHTWITRMLERGVGVATVAALAGNSPGVLLRVYSHVNENEDHLRAQLNRAIG